MYPLGNILNGEWQRAVELTDYRTETLTNMVVERATWAPDALERLIGDTVIARAGYVCLRFWLFDDEALVEKYYDAQGQTIGYYIPVSMPLKRRNDGIQAFSLLLALWLQPDDRITVLHEEPFELAVTNGEITPVEAEHAEYQIRELTSAMVRKHYPPALVRNFEIEL